GGGRSSGSRRPYAVDGGTREHGSPLGRASGALIRRREVGDVVFRRIVRERARRDFRDQLIAIDDLEMKLGGHDADRGTVQLPSGKDALDVRLTAWARDDEHSFL